MSTLTGKAHTPIAIFSNEEHMMATAPCVCTQESIDHQMPSIYSKQLGGSDNRKYQNPVVFKNASSFISSNSLENVSWWPTCRTLRDKREKAQKETSCWVGEG